LALSKNSYEKCSRLTLMKLMADVNFLNKIAYDKFRVVVVDRWSLTQELVNCEIGAGKAKQ